MAPVSRTRGRPHISVTTSMSRWMPSGSAGRLANREPDQALITASLAAQRAAKCRAADELLSAASRRSPGVNVSANTVPGRSTCSANSGMETRSMPIPTILTPGTLSHPRPFARQRSPREVLVVGAQAGIRVQQHRCLLRLLRPVVAEPTVRRSLVHRLAAGDRRRQPTLPGQGALLRPLDVVLPLRRIQR